MGKSIDTLVADIWSVLDETTDHDVSEDNVEWAANVFADMLRTRFKKREGGNALRFSSLGKQPRQLWYSQNMPEEAEKLPPKTLFKFMFGDCLEVLLLFLAKEAGHDVTHLQHEVEIEDIKGHTDAVIDNTVVDVKSASPYSYKKFVDGSFVFDDPFGYIPQLSGYAHALGAASRAGFLVTDKSGGDIHFAEIDELTIKGNEPGQRIRRLKEVLKNDTPPPRCYEDEEDGKSGNRKLGVSCSYCPFKYECWKDSNSGEGLRMFFYSTGPRWLTKVGKVPNVPEHTFGSEPEVSVG